MGAEPFYTLSRREGANYTDGGQSDHRCCVEVGESGGLMDTNTSWCFLSDLKCFWLVVRRIHHTTQRACTTCCTAPVEVAATVGDAQRA